MHWYSGNFEICLYVYPVSCTMMTMQVDHAIAEAVRLQKPVYISISCNLAGITHPTFDPNPCTICHLCQALKPKVATPYTPFISLYSPFWTALLSYQILCTTVDCGTEKILPMLCWSGNKQSCPRWVVFCTLMYSLLYMDPDRWSSYKCTLSS